MKKLLGIAALAALVLTGCSKDLQVQPVDKLTVEYGDKLDNSKLFHAKESDENVKVDKINGFDAKKVGDQKLKVTFSDGDKSTEKEIKVTVKDTKKPEITLKKDKITITAGDKLDLKDNVKSVKDSVDGDLKYNDKEIKKSGYYIDKGKLNIKKAGTYEVKVLAYDVNGNASEKSFKVIVKKKEVAKQETDSGQNSGTQGSSGTSQAASSSSPSSSSGQGTTSNGNGSASSGETSSTGGNQSTPTKPVACPEGKDTSLPCDYVLPGQVVGLDGVYYDTWENANEAGRKLGKSGVIDGFGCMTVFLNNGEERWVILAQ